MIRTQLTSLISLTDSTGVVLSNTPPNKIYWKGFLAHNTGLTNVSLDVYFRPTSGTPNNTNSLFSFQLGPRETVLIDVPYCFTLTGNNVIMANSSINSGINFICFGDRE